MGRTLAAPGAAGQRVQPSLERRNLDPRFYTLYAPALFLLALDHALYRLVTDQLFALWQLYPVALFEWLFQTQLHLYGDLVDPEETSLIIMNHRTRVDWNYAWIALYHAERQAEEAAPCREPSVREHTDHDSLTEETAPCDASNQKAPNNTIIHNFYSKLTSTFTKKAKLKYVLKDEIKRIPGIGWIMQLNNFLYLKRKWAEDERSMRQWLEYYRRMSCKLQILMFPEGTDLSRQSRLASDRYAAANNKQSYEFVLHPRTRGFAALCSRLRDAGAGLGAVYDATLAYDAPPAGELAVLRGDYPRHVYAHFQRIAASELPQGEEALRRWLAGRWRGKEASLRHFHNHGAFLDSKGNSEPARRRPRPLAPAKLAFLFWTALDVAFLLALVRSSCFQCWVMYNTLLFTFVTWQFGGFHNVQNTLFK